MSDGTILGHCFMKTLLAALLLLSCVAIRAEPPAPQQEWEAKVFGELHLDVPAGSQTKTRNSAGASVVKKMTRYSFQNSKLDLELVFLDYDPGFEGDIDGAAKNMGDQMRAMTGDEIPPWKVITVAGRPARTLASNPDKTHQARMVTLIDDTKAGRQLIIVDVSYDTDSAAAKADAGHIINSVEIK